MILPPSGMFRTARCARRNGALAFTAKYRSRSSAVTSSGWIPSLPVTAALFTRMSRVVSPVRSLRPCSRPRNSSCTSPGTPSSARTGKALPPSFSIRVTVSRAASSLLA